MTFDLLTIHIKDVFQRFGFSSCPNERYDKWREEVQEVKDAWAEGDHEHILDELCDVFITTVALMWSMGVVNPLWRVWLKLMKTDAKYRRLENGETLEVP